MSLQIATFHSELGWIKHVMKITYLVSYVLIIFMHLYTSIISLFVSTEIWEYFPLQAFNRSTTAELCKAIYARIVSVSTVSSVKEYETNHDVGHRQKASFLLHLHNVTTRSSRVGTNRHWRETQFGGRAWFGNERFMNHHLNPVVRSV